jgi:hypothetical protein
VEAWARRLEHAAYGESDVTREIETDVREAEPRPPNPIRPAEAVAAPPHIPPELRARRPNALR